MLSTLEQLFTRRNILYSYRSHNIPVSILAINKHSIIHLEKRILSNDEFVLIVCVNTKAIIPMNTQANETPIRTF